MELTIQLPHGDERLAVTGTAERNLKILRESLGVSIASRNGALRISGDSRAVGQAAHLIERLSDAARRDEPIDRQGLLELVAAAGSMPLAGGAERRAPGQPPTLVSDQLEVYVAGRRIKPLTDGQRGYLHAIQTHDLTFCTGPAGTGKTYLAVAAAVAMLKQGQVRKLVLVRPAVEAGEKLGFLPGTMQDKVNPYLRPLLDALHDMMEFNQIERFMAVDVVEIIPLAFMRGRTLNDAAIILDEAQNATRGQMLMFLTRLGHGSKMIVTGDTSQTDLEDPRDSGLVDAIHRLKRTEGVTMVTLGGADIVRHRLVQRIVDAYQPRPAANRDTGPESDRSAGETTE